MKGATEVISGRENKTVVTSLREVAAGKVYFDTEGGLVDTDEAIEADISR
jgi:DNA-directed RNA polymerase subunit K/omega